MTCRGSAVYWPHSRLSASFILLLWHVPVARSLCQVPGAEALLSPLTVPAHRPQPDLSVFSSCGYNRKVDGSWESSKPQHHARHCINWPPICSGLFTFKFRSEGKHGYQAQSSTVLCFLGARFVSFVLDFQFPLTACCEALGLAAPSISVFL